MLFLCVLHVCLFFINLVHRHGKKNCFQLTSPCIQGGQNKTKFFGGRSYPGLEQLSWIWFLTTLWKFQVQSHKWEVQISNISSQFCLKALFPLQNIASKYFHREGKYPKWKYPLQQFVSMQLAYLQEHFQVLDKLILAAYHC